MNELWIENYGNVLIEQDRNIKGYAYHLNDRQNQLFNKIESAPSEEAQTFYYMDFIATGIKTEISDWIIKNIQNKMNHYENRGISYFGLLNKQASNNKVSMFPVWY